MKTTREILFAFAVARFASFGNAQSCPDQPSSTAASNACTGSFGSNVINGEGTYTCSSCSGTGLICPSPPCDGGGGSGSLESCQDFISVDTASSFCTGNFFYQGTRDFGTYSCSSCSGEGVICSDLPCPIPASVSGATCGEASILAASCSQLESFCQENDFGPLVFANVDSDGGPFECFGCSSGVAVLGNSFTDEDALSKSARIGAAALYIVSCTVFFGISVFLAHTWNGKQTRKYLVAPSTSSIWQSHPLAQLFCVNGLFMMLHETMALWQSFSLTVGFESPDIFENFLQENTQCAVISLGSTSQASNLSISLSALIVSGFQVAALTIIGRGLLNAAIANAKRTEKTVADDLIVVSCDSLLSLILFIFVLIKAYQDVEDTFPRGEILTEFAKVFAISILLTWLFQPFRLRIYRSIYNSFFQAVEDPGDEEKQVQIESATS